MPVTTLRHIAAYLYLTAQLSAEAYWQRLRQGRSPFSPTYGYPPRSLHRPPVDGRTLSREPFLRPTRHADSHAPEVIALADQLRARASNDLQYAEAIFNYVGNGIDFCFELPPRRAVVGTLARGFGTCHEKLNLLVALARAGGIPARYCTIGIGQAGVLSLMHDDDGLFGMLTFGYKRFLMEENDPRAKRIVSFILRLSSRMRRQLKARALDPTRDPSGDPWLHYVAELRVGESWIPADPTFGDEDCVALNLPLQRFGDEPFFLRKGMGMAINGRMESIPSMPWPVYMFGVARICIERGNFNHLNHFGNRLRSRGRDILAERGARGNDPHASAPVPAAAGRHRRAV